MRSPILITWASGESTSRAFRRRSQPTNNFSICISESSKSREERVRTDEFLPFRSRFFTTALRFKKMINIYTYMKTHHNIYIYFPHRKKRKTPRNTLPINKRSKKKKANNPRKKRVISRPVRTRLTRGKAVLPSRVSPV